MYLIPANSKKGQLIFNMFRPIDLIIFVVGATVSILFMLILPDSGVVTLVIKLAPILTSALLVMPVPHYHNVMMFLKDIFSFYINRNTYVWKGWCVNSEYTED